MLRIILLSVVCSVAAVTSSFAQGVPNRPNLGEPFVVWLDIYPFDGASEYAASQVEVYVQQAFGPITDVQTADAETSMNWPHYMLSMEVADVSSGGDRIYSYSFVWLRMQVSGADSDFLDAHEPRDADEDRLRWLADKARQGWRSLYTSHAYFGDLDRVRVSITDLVREIDQQIISRQRALVR